MAMDARPDRHDLHELHLMILQAAVFALFRTARDKEAVRAVFDQLSQVVIDQAMNFPIAEATIEDVRQLREKLLKLLT
jgi:hypothetical protein